MGPVDHMLVDLTITYPMGLVDHILVDIVKDKSNSYRVSQVLLAWWSTISFVFIGGNIFIFFVDDNSNSSRSISTWQIYIWYYTYKQEPQ